MISVTARLYEIIFGAEKHLLCSGFDFYVFVVFQASEFVSNRIGFRGFYRRYRNIFRDVRKIRFIPYDVVARRGNGYGDVRQRLPLFQGFHDVGLPLLDKGNRIGLRLDRFPRRRQRYIFGNSPDTRQRDRRYSVFPAHKRIIVSYGQLQRIFRIVGKNLCLCGHGTLVCVVSHGILLWRFYGVDNLIRRHVCQIDVLPVHRIARNGLCLGNLRNRFSRFDNPHDVGLPRLHKSDRICLNERRRILPFSAGSPKGRQYYGSYHGR